MATSSSEPHHALTIKAATDATDPCGSPLGRNSSSPLGDAEAHAHDDNDAPVALAWKDITVNARRHKRPLLNGVTGKITTGLYAVMGPSGSGKSTLLNTLACRLDRNVEVQGEIRLNGQPYSNAELKKMSGYVMQVCVLCVRVNRVR